MKILHLTPLLIAGAAIVIAAVSILTNVSIAVPDIFGAGIGLATVAGLGGMLVQDAA
jgi:hypothetical protein